ncbi:MAG: hypothetical protein OXQ84_20360 [bacterium]|nr:hypothetical protein [bacterium]
MARHQAHSIAFSRRLVQARIAGKTLDGPARRRELALTLIRTWLDKPEDYPFDEDAEVFDTI